MSTYLRDFPSYSSHFVPFPLSLGQEKDSKNTVKSLSQAMYIGVLLIRKVCTECMEMDIFSESCCASDHISHLNKVLVPIARGTKHLNVATIIMCPS